MKQQIPPTAVQIRSTNGQAEKFSALANEVE